MIDVTKYGRQTYRLSGRVNWCRFLISAPAVFLTSLFVCSLLCLFYYSPAVIIVRKFVAIFLIAVPIAAGVVLGVVPAHAVKFSECRNRFLGGALGFVCGTMLCLAQYHGLYLYSAFRSGLPLAESVLRVDQIPWVIWTRIFTDIAPDGVSAVHGSQLAAINRSIVALIDLGFLAGIPFYLGRGSATRVYLETKRRWAKGMHINAKSGAGHMLLSAVKNGLSLADAMSNLSLHWMSPSSPEPTLFRFEVRPRGSVERTFLLLEYDVAPSAEDADSAFLSVTEFNERGRKERALVQLELRPDEVLAARRFVL